MIELGRTYYEGQRYDLAEQTLRKAIQLAPDQGGAYYWLGLVLSRLGRSQEGLEALHMSVRLDPKNPWARIDLANRLAAMGEYGKGVCEYIKARELANQAEFLQKIEDGMAALPIDADGFRQCSD